MPSKPVINTIKTASKWLGCVNFGHSFLLLENPISLTNAMLLFYCLFNIALAKIKKTH